MIPAHMAVVLHELRDRNWVATDRLDGAGHHLRPALADPCTQNARRLHGCALSTVKKKGLLDDEEFLEIVRQVVP